MTRYIITQDGGGIIFSHDFDSKSLYTYDLESCTAYIFYGDNAIALVHDTGQLLISSIVEFVQKCGHIKKVVYGQNRNQIRSLEEDNHRNRMKNILSMLSFSEEAKPANLNEGEIFVSNKELIYKKNDLNKVKDTIKINKFPDAEKRHTINLLNNLFIEKNAQSIPLDIQYNGNEYTTMPRLINTIKEMSERAMLEKLHGDLDYENILRVAMQDGIV